MSSTDTKTGAAAALQFRIDNELCAGHGRCYALDPEHFDSDDVGYGVVLGDGEPESARAAMEETAAACPEEAIVVEKLEATS